MAVFLWHKEQLQVPLPSFSFWFCYKLGLKNKSPDLSGNQGYTDPKAALVVHAAALARHGETLGGASLPSGEKIQLGFLPQKAAIPGT